MAEPQLSLISGPGTGRPDAKSVESETKSCVSTNPRDYLSLIESLGHTVITQDQHMLFNQAQVLAAESKGDTHSSILQDYIGLIRSTRSTIDEDPELDRKLAVAASNAASIISYANTCGLTTIGLHAFRDFSHCRIPHANFSTGILYRCNFDHTDLSEALFFGTDLRNCSFKFSNLKHATTYRDEYCKRAYPGTALWHTVCVAPDESEFACVSPESAPGGVWIWDTQTLEVKRRLPALREGCEVVSLSYSPDTQYIATADMSEYSCIMNASTGELVFTLGPHEAGVYTVAYHPDGIHIATGTGNGSVWFWNLTFQPPKRIWKTCGTEIRGLTGKWSIYITRLIRFSLDGSKVGYITGDSTIHVVECATGRVIHKWQPLEADDVQCGMEFSKDSCFLAFHIGKCFEIYDLASSTPVVQVPNVMGLNQLFDASLPEVNSESIFTHCELRGINIWRLPQLFGPFFAPLSGGQRFISYDSIDHANSANWTTTLSAHIDPTSIASERMVHMSLDPMGAFIACQTDSGLYLRNLATLRIIASVREPDPLSFRELSSTSQLIVSKDGRRIVCVGFSWVVIVDTTSCTATHSISHQPHLTPFRNTAERDVNINLGKAPSVALSQDGNMLAMTKHDSDPCVLILDLVHNTTITLALPPCRRARRSHSTRVHGLCFSHDGSKLSGARSNGDIITWNVSSQEILFNWVAVGCQEHSAAMASISFAPDDTRIAATGPPNFIHIWHFSDLLSKITSTYHAREVRDFAWSSDGRFLISGALDGIRFWDTSSWECVRHCKDVGAIRSMSLNSHDSLFATIGADDAFALWKLYLTPSQGADASPESVSCVDLELKAICRLHDNSEAALLLGRFEELNPSFQRCVENDMIEPSKSNESYEYGDAEFEEFGSEDEDEAEY